MKVIAWGTYDLSKPRTRILLDALAARGIDVQEIHTDIWSDVRDKSGLGGRAKLRLAARWLTAYPGLLARYLVAPRADAVFVGYLGQLDVLLLRPLAWLRREPIVWDAFISLYDTVINDRHLAAPRSALGRLLLAWEWLACHAANVVVLDTAAHARFFEDTYAVPGRTAAAFVGAEAAFAPSAARVHAPTADEARPLEVLFYGQFIPLHGIETIVEAARRADPKRVRFVLVGQGQEGARIRALLDAAPLANVEWIPWIEYEDLAAKIAEADICLGIFGASDKAARVIPNKVFQILTAGKPLITRDSPAIRELIHADDVGVYLVPPADPDALVAAIERYRTERQRLIEPLHGDIVARFSTETIGAALTDAIDAARAHRSPMRR